MPTDNVVNSAACQQCYGCFDFEECRLVLFTIIVTLTTLERKDVHVCWLGADIPGQWTNTYMHYIYIIAL